MTEPKKKAPKKAEATTNLNLVQKVAEIMAGITPMFKSETAGSGSYGYKFISVNDMLDIARPKLAEKGIIFYGSVQDMERFTGQGRNGNQTFVYLTVRWFVRDGDEEFSFVTLGEASDTGDKAANKAFTAAQKQAISKLLMMSGTDDDNDRNMSPRDEAPEQRVATRDPGANHPQVIKAKEGIAARNRATALLEKMEQNKAAWAGLISAKFPEYVGRSSNDLKKEDWQKIEKWADSIVNAPKADTDIEESFNEE
tara:strand:- start:557 stop:1318 length:762 start_codon:yes stop_codon:yes gene_type:complete